MRRSSIRQCLNVKWRGPGDQSRSTNGIRNSICSGEITAQSKRRQSCLRRAAERISSQTGRRNSLSKILCTTSPTGEQSRTDSITSPTRLQSHCHRAAGLLGVPTGILLKTPKWQSQHWGLTGNQLRVVTVFYLCKSGGCLNLKCCLHQDNPAPEREGKEGQLEAPGSAFHS